MKVLLIKIFIIILSILLSCNSRDNRNQSVNNNNNLKNGYYPTYEYTQLPKVKKSFEKSGVKEVLLEIMNRGKTVADVLRNYKTSYNNFSSNLITIDNSIEGCYFSFYLDSISMLRLTFSINSEDIFSIENLTEKERWRRVLKQSDFKILTQKINVKKYIDSFEDFDTSKYIYKLTYNKIIEPFDSINMIKYNKRFIDF